MGSIITLQFFQNALWASILSAIVCGVIGSYIVARRIVFISGGITHASFGGLGVGLYLGINPIITACIVAVTAAIGIEKLNKYGKMHEDSAIAGIWALGMAIGILFMNLTPGYTSGLSSYLFGNILLVGNIDLIALATLASLLIGIFTLCYKPILYSTFDKDFALTRGVAASRWSLLLLTLSSVSMVLCIRLVGIMLLMSLLTIPQSIMALYTANFKKIIIGSILLNIIGNLIGLTLGIYFPSIPTGVLIVIIQFCFLCLAQCTKHILHR